MLTRGEVSGLLALLGGLLLAPGSHATQCPTLGLDGQYHSVEEGLEWCSRNSSGFNEGAECGATALSSTTVPGLASLAVQPVLGNIWSRTDMMNATRQAWNLNFTNQAIQSAICCQVHNPHMHNCLAANQSAIADWLSGRVAQPRPPTSPPGPPPGFGSPAQTPPKPVSTEPWIKWKLMRFLDGRRVITFSLEPSSGKGSNIVYFLDDFRRLARQSATKYSRDVARDLEEIEALVNDASDGEPGGGFEATPKLRSALGLPAMPFHDPFDDFDPDF